MGADPRAFRVIIKRRVVEYRTPVIVCIEKISGILRELQDEAGALVGK